MVLKRRKKKHLIALEVLTSKVTANLPYDRANLINGLNYYEYEAIKEEHVL
jgi:hypothetical protein